MGVARKRNGEKVTWTGLSACWCTECEELFNSEHAFNLHWRKGHRHPEEAGMVKNARGLWVSELRGM